MSPVMNKKLEKNCPPLLSSSQGGSIPGPYIGTLFVPTVCIFKFIFVAARATKLANSASAESTVFPPSLDPIDTNILLITNRVCNTMYRISEYRYQWATDSL